MYRIAVTGVGGGCGQSIIRALMRSDIAMDIYPVDVTPLSAGLYNIHNRWNIMQGTVLPKPEDDIKAWMRFVEDKGIDAIIPGSDHDLAPLSFYQKPLKALVNSMNVVEISNDKALTAKLQVCTPPSLYHDFENRLTAFVAQHWFPLVVKPRFGMTSRGVHVVNDQDELDFFLRKTSRPIVQKYIGGDEYTCALYFDRRSDLVASFQMKRWLYAGTTYRAEVSDDPIVQDFMNQVAETLKPFHAHGALNIQLKVDNNVPYLLEINARCSGSTSIRAHFGYNEPDMLIRDHLSGMEITQPKTAGGIAFRYWNETFLDTPNFEALQ